MHTEGLTLRNGVVKNFATDLSLGEHMLVFEERKFYSKEFPQIIEQHIPHSY